MKTTCIYLPIILVLVSFVFCSAQDTEISSTSKGKILLGAGTNLSVAQASIADVDDKLTNINLNLTVGYFVVDRLAVGLQTGYQYTKFGDDDSNSITYGVFGRYYTKSNFFLGSGYIISKSESSESVGYIPVELGYAYFLTPSVAIEPAIDLGIGGHNNDSFIYALSVGLSLYLR